MNPSKLFGASLCLLSLFVGIAAYGDGLVRLTHGGQTTDYATFGEANNAAADGDTLTLLNDVDVSTGSLTITKSVTLDLNGRTISKPESGQSFNLLYVNNGAQVVIRNGTLHSHYQSVLVPNSDNSSVELTDCVVSGGTMTWSDKSGVQITIGQGCVVTCKTLICGNDGNKVVIEDGEVYSSALRTGGTLVVRGGRFASDPAAYLDSQYEAVAESQTTDHGTVNYRVQKATSFAAVVIRAASGEEENFASIPAAVAAAGDGDTVRFNADWVDPGNPYKISKAITLDLNNHAISNNVGYNMLNIAATPVVIKNGLLSTPGNSSIVFQNGAHVAYLTNCLVTGSTLAYSPSAAELHIGDGCRFTCAALASGHETCHVNVFVESDDVVCTSSKLFDSGVNDKIYSHLFVRGGKFAVDPSLSVVGGRKAVAQSVSTDIGTCNYAVVDRTGEETVVAEAVFPNGETVKSATLDDAVKAARIGDTVRFLADQVSEVNILHLGKRIVYDLNGHTYRNGVNCNFLCADVDGIVFQNGTIEGDYQSLFYPQANTTVYVTNCTLKGNCSAYSSAANARVVISGGRLDVKAACSGHSTSTVQVEIDGSLCKVDSAWVDNGGAGSSTLVIHGCSATRDPGPYVDEALYVAPETRVVGDVTYTYSAFPEEDADLHDLSSCVALVGRRYYTTFADAYTATPDCGELRLVQDVSISAFQFRKTMTLNLNGFTLSQADVGSNFLNLYDGHSFVITGGGKGGTVAKNGGQSALWIATGTITVEDCTVSGGTFAYSGSAQSVVNVNSDNAVIQCSALVSSHSTCNITLNFVAGKMLSANIWDGAVPADGTHGGYVNALGGTWNQDPVTVAKAYGKVFVLGDGLWSRCDPATGLYTLVPIPETLTCDLSNATAYTYTGTVPAEGLSVLVNLVDSGAWDAKRRVVFGDFSALENADKLNFVLGAVPEGAPEDLFIRSANGKLFANVPRGMAVILR